MAHEIDLKTMEEFRPYLAAREAVKNTLNEEISSLKKSIENTISKNKETIISSITFQKELIIFLNQQVLDNLFSSVKHSAEDGLEVLSIDILHREHLGSFEFKIFNNIEIRFNFKNPAFNNDWNKFSLDNLEWNDEKFRIYETSSGLCLQPRFKEEDYWQIKSLLSSLKNQILEIPKYKNP